MRIIALMLLAVCCLPARAQKISKELVYPVPGEIKVKWPRDGYSMPKVSFDECISGDCKEGQGTRLILDAFKYEGYGYYLYFTFLKGVFSKDGNQFTGEVYKPKIRFSANDKKHLVPAAPFDFTDAALLSKAFMGKGSYQLSGYSPGWHGEALPVAFAKKFPGATVRNASFKNRQLEWLDIDLPAGNRFIRYTGRTLISGDFFSGKVTLANGDSYEGFFLQHTFFGPGKLTKKNGKVRQGIWQQDSLLIETAVELPSWLFEKDLPPKAPTQYTFKPEVDGKAQFNPDFYGSVVNEVANGWGLSSFNWGTAQYGGNGLVYGLWKNNKLDGPGILVAVPAPYDLSFSPGALAEQFWVKAGIFKDSKLAQGSWFYSAFDTYPNKELDENDIMNMNLKDFSMQTGSFDDKGLQGCGAFMKGYGLQANGQFGIHDLQEGFFTNGAPGGFYFENDFTRSRSLEKLRFKAPYIITEKDVQAAEANNDLCSDAMRKLKPQYMAAMKKKLAGDLAAAEEAKKPPPPFNPFAHLQPETSFEATEADYAKVDWDAIGEKRARAGKATRQSIQFWETVSADIRKYLNQTYQMNGGTYKRYSRTRYFSPSGYREGSHEINVTGKKTSFLILHYCERTGSDAKANVSIQYEGKKIENNKFISGGKCELITQCSTGSICKTECPGAFEFDEFRNTYYGLYMNHTGNWSGAREFWIVLKDEQNTK